MGKHSSATHAPFPSPGQQPRRHRRWPLAAVAVVLVVMLLAGGTAWAAYRYDRDNLGHMLPGVSIAGVDVSDMTRAEALAALAEKYDTIFAKETVVKVAGRKWIISPAEMGARVPIQGAVDQALALEDQYGWTERAWRRWNVQSEDRDFSVEVTMDPELSRAFVAKVSGAVGENPVSGGLRLAGSQLEFIKDQPGRELMGEKALLQVRDALRTGKPEIKLAMRRLKPKATGKATRVIVVDLSEERLYLYEGKSMQKKYLVATGAPGFPTPTGSFEIVEMRKNPTWVNPDPTGWGASMPDSIPPGPGNPLGTRAMNLNAPGIRIHGTSDVASLGTAASHGCVRMAMSDVEEVFDLVGVGTAVLIKR